MPAKKLIQNSVILRAQNFARNRPTCAELAIVRRINKRHRKCKIKLCRFCSAVLLLVRHWRLPQPVQTISV